MPTPKERLSHLLELAAQGPEQRAALAGEVADLLLDWPVQYPAAMRATFEALLEKIAREMEFTARGQLAARFAGRGDAPLPLLNEFFLAAPAEMKDVNLARNEAADEVAFATIDTDALLAAARARENFSAALVNAAGLRESTAAEIAADASGRALATLCKGANVNRATFSALMVLAGPVRKVHDNFALLSVYDRVPAKGAARLLEFWRAKQDNTAEVREAAA